jgi:tripartite-type tricarboxylate transporter receptor subunit TctC
VAAGVVAKSDPDGHTLLQAAANMAINPILMTDLPYDTAKDFAPVSLTHSHALCIRGELAVADQHDRGPAQVRQGQSRKVTYGTTARAARSSSQPAARAEPWGCAA